MTPIRFGLVGLGRFGTHYARLLTQIPGAVLVKSSRRDMNDVLASDVEAVVIATPASTHHDLILAALTAGKHVLVEKPMVLSVAEAQNVAAAVKASGKCFMVGHQYRYHDAIRELESMVHHGAFGAVRFVAALQLSPGPVRTGVGAFFEMATHELSIIDFICNPGAPRDVYGLATGVRVATHEDTAAANVVFENGLLASLVVSWQAPTKVRRLMILGDAGSATFELCADGEVLRQYTKDRVLISEFRAVREPLRVQVEHFINCIRTGCASETGIEHGVRITEWLAMIRGSLVDA